MHRPVYLLPFPRVLHLVDDHELEVDHLSCAQRKGLILFSLLRPDGVRSAAVLGVVVLKDRAFNNCADFGVRLESFKVLLVHPFDHYALKVCKLLVHVQATILARLVQNDSVFPRPIFGYKCAYFWILDLRDVDRVQLRARMLNLTIMQLSWSVLSADPDEIRVEHLALVAEFRHLQIFIELPLSLVLPYLMRLHIFDKLLLHLLLQFLSLLYPFLQLNLSDGFQLIRQLYLNV